MANIFHTLKLNHFLIYSTLTAFSMTCAFPPAYGQVFNGGNSINEISLMIRLEKIVEKLMKLEKKGKPNEMIDLMLQVKHEVENATGQVIQIEPHLNKIYGEVGKKGYRIPKKQLDSLKKKIKIKEKKSKFHTEYIGMVLSDPKATINLDDELTLYRAKHGHDKEDEKEEQCIELPVGIAFGVTVALCGAFLCFLPIPQAKSWGIYLIEFGVGFAAQGTISKVEKDEEDKKKK